MTEPFELRPVDQTVLGVGNPRANCFQACLAMVLNMPIEECFDITAPEVGDFWVEPLEQWALGLGYAMHSGIKAPSGIPYIANGPTHKRESIHGVVCIDGAMFHDPHPSRDGIESVNYYLWFTPCSVERQRWTPPAGAMSNYGSNDMGYGFEQIEDATYEPADDDQ